MSAELLREAAALMRERAEAAIATGVWRGDETDNTTAANGAFTHHVATFANPAVALAVADWLEVTAARVNTPAQATLPQRNAALAVARAYMNSGVPNV